MSKVGYADVDYCDFGAIVYYNSDDGNNYDVDNEDYVGGRR